MNPSDAMRSKPKLKPLKCCHKCNAAVYAIFSVKIQQTSSDRRDMRKVELHPLCLVCLDLQIKKFKEQLMTNGALT